MTGADLFTVGSGVLIGVALGSMAIRLLIDRKPRRPIVILRDGVPPVDRCTEVIRGQVRADGRGQRVTVVAYTPGRRWLVHYQWGQESTLSEATIVSLYPYVLGLAA